MTHFPRQVGKTVSRLGIWRLFAALAGLVLTAWIPAGAEEVDRLEIVDRAIEFHGGLRFESARVELELCSASGCSELKVHTDQGLYDYRVEGPYRGERRAVRITNDRVEHWLDGVAQAVEGAEAERNLRDWVMARIYFCFLPYRLNDPDVFKEDLGTETWNGRDLRKVRVTFAPGSSTDSQDRFMYWLDPATGRVEMFAYTYERDGGGLRFRRAFNYRRIGGLLFFDQENLGREGPEESVDSITPEVVEALRHVSTVELRSITVTPN